MSFNPDWRVHPGETLREVLEDRLRAGVLVIGLTEIPQETLNGIIEGREPVTPPIAKQLERSLGISAGFWLRLQENYDVPRA